MSEEPRQEDFADAILNDPTMTDAQKIKWLHEAAMDRMAKLDAVRSERDGLLRARTLIADRAFEGLHTDGGHHKQWFLEQILELSSVLDDDAVDDWPPGVQP